MSFIHDDPPAICSRWEQLPDFTTTLNRCSRCRTVAYCSKACQAAHWPTHQPSCKQCIYTYDFGDGWDHHIQVTGRGAATSTFSCTGGEGARPFEDAGGPQGWKELKQEIRAGTCNEDRKFDMLNYGIDLDTLDPKKFHTWSLEDANATLAEWHAGKFQLYSQR